MNHVGSDTALCVSGYIQVSLTEGDLCSGIRMKRWDKTGLIFIILSFDETHLTQRGKIEECKRGKSNKTGD